MRVTPIRRPLSGERLVSVEPPLNPNVDARWQRRLNLYTGRALSDAALTTEQASRAGRLATRGQLVSPGIVNGLIVGLEGPRRLPIQPIIPIEKDPNALRTQYFFHISSGAGIMPSGEDVVLSRNLRVAVGDVPVYTTIDLLTKDGPKPVGPDAAPPLAADTAFGERMEAPPAAAAAPVLKPRRLGPPLIELDKAGVVFPRAAILLLQPIVLKRVGEFDDEDPCEQDPQDYAFEDWQLVDGCHLMLYTWPTELTESLPFPEPEGFMQWRNRLAYSIFEAEMDSADPRGLLPWEELGLPIGLVGFDPDNLPFFIDRYSVARDGGKPKRRSLLVPDISDIKAGQEAEDFEKINRYTALVPHAGHPFLWQARLQQFTEQLAEALRDAPSVAAVSGQFRFLPPVGLLPKGAVTFTAGQIYNNFFPNSFEIDVVPVPLEQLDVVINQSVSLSLFDVNDSDRLRVLVPVPQIYYEPELLEVEKIDPEFDKNIATSLRKLGKWLRRRDDMHTIGKAINADLDGQSATYPELEYIGEDENNILPNLISIDPLDTDDPGDTELNKPEEVYEMTGIPLRSTAYLNLRSSLTGGVDFPIRVVIDALGTPGQFNIMDKLGLENFIELLEQKVKQADDIIDFGFVRVQTDIYRYRQLMLGTDAARLVTSPALAAIAKGETALATKEEIISFVQKARLTGNPAFAAAALGDGLADDGNSSALVAVEVGPNMHAESSNVAAAADMHTPNPEATASNFAEPATGIAAGIRSTNGSTVRNANLVIGDSVSLKQTSTTTLFKAATPAYTRDSIRQQTAIVGRPLDFRTVTIAERIKQAPAPEAKDFTVSSKYEVLKALEELAKIIVMEDLVFPGFYDYAEEPGTGNLSLKKRNVDSFDRTGKKTTTQMAVETPQTFRAVRDKRLSTQVLSGLHDLDPTNGDEPAFFAAAVRASDHTVAYLRIVEGRIQAYRNILADCKKVLSQLDEMAAKIESRLNVIEDHLAEMRHDLAVARALKADEEVRVDNINKRRTEIIREHVPFLAFRRERTIDLHVTSVKVRELDPEMVESPVPACLARDVTPPPELHATVDLLRDAPVKWFINVHPLLDKFDRLEHLYRVVLSAKTRAAAIPLPTPAPPPRITASFGQAIGRVIQAQASVVAQLRVQTAQFDLSAFAAQSWQLARDQAREVVSLGDLIDGSHGRGDVSQQAAREVSNITHLSACLYSALSVVLPVIRLNWAERISQFDDAVDLRNLGGLPRWGEIEYLDRREMQTYVDWLFSRIDRKQPEAISLINDLVRVCILLASHAPVNQIVSAHIAQKSEVREGGSIKLAVDPARVRVGMHVLVYRAGQVAARAVVEDLMSGQAAARVIKVHTASKTASLEENDHVQIAESGAFDRNPLSFVKAQLKKPLVVSAVKKK
jgi:hypothetical protein